MNRKYQFLALLLGSLIALLNSPAFADRPPSWMVGTFENDARRDERAITLTVASDGTMSATAVGGDLNSITTLSANYRDNVFNLGGQDYTVSRSGNGFRAVPDTRRRPLENNRIVTLQFHRVSDYNGTRQPGGIYNSEQRVPNWMVGTFEGSARPDGTIITLNIGDDGSMSATGRAGVRRNDRLPIRYRGDLFTVDGFDYRVQQTRNGFSAVATDRRNGTINFRRTGDYIVDRKDNSGRNDGGSYADQRIPTWLSGVFEGANPNDGSLMTLRISQDGAMSATGRSGSRRSGSLPITYRRNLLTIDGLDYRIQQTRNGFNAVATDRRNSQIAFRRTGDYADDRSNSGNTRIPDWMIGRFEGRSGRNGQSISLNITNDGRVTARERINNRDADRLNASYRRNILTIDARDYRVERINDGFRAILDEDSNDRSGRNNDLNSRIDFRRL